MSQTTTQSQSTRDESRNIRNIRTHERFVRNKNKQTLQSQLRADMSFKKDNASQDENTADAQNQHHAPYRKNIRNEFEDKKTIHPSHISIKKQVKLGSFTLFSGIGLLGSLACFQFFFAIISAVGFGLEILQRQLVDANWVTRLIGSAVSSVADTIQYLTSFDIGMLIPFELIGWSGLVIIILITISICIGYTLFFILQGVRIFDTPMSILLVAVLSLLNITPFINIFPWIELWALLIILKNIKQKTQSVSTVGR